MKKLLLIVIILFYSHSYSQKTTIGLTTFESTAFIDHKEAEAITEKVKELFFESKRFIPIDRTAYTETNKFKVADIQKNINYINGYVIEQGKLKGAKSIVGGKITSVSYKETKNGSIRCDINFSISISDVETGELLATQTFSGGIIPTNLNGVTETQALANTIRSYTNKIKNYIIENVPFYASVHSIKLQDKNAEIQIIAGNNEGVHKGDRFGIYEVKDIETKKGVKQLKELIVKFSIKSVNGDFSKSKIKKDSDILLNKYNDDEVILICQSIKKSSISF